VSGHSATSPAADLRLRFPGPPTWLRSIGVGDEGTRGSFQLWSGVGLSGKALDKIADALALLFGAGRELNPHAMSGVHDADQAFGMNFHAGDAQAQVDGRRLRKRGFGLHIASAQTQVRQLTWLIASGSPGKKSCE